MFTKVSIFAAAVMAAGATAYNKDKHDWISTEHRFVAKCASDDRNTHVHFFQFVDPDTGAGKEVYLNSHYVGLAPDTPYELVLFDKQVTDCAMVDELDISRSMG